MSVEYAGRIYEVVTSDDGMLMLDLFEEQIDDMSQIHGLDQLTDLQQLDVGGNAIQEVCGLDNLILLRILSLAGNQLTRIQNLDQLVNLEKLDVSKNQLTSTRGLEQLINLESLNLANNKIPWNEMATLANLTHLKELDINHNPFDKVALQDLGGHIYGKVKDPQRVVEYFRDLEFQKKYAKSSSSPVIHHSHITTEKGEIKFGTTSTPKSPPIIEKQKGKKPQEIPATGIKPKPVIKPTTTSGTLPPRSNESQVLSRSY